MGTKQPNMKLKAARDRFPYSQQEVADMVGVALSTYQTWEAGLFMPQPKYKRLLCKVLAASLEDLGLATGNDDTPAGTIELGDASEYREEQNEYLQSDLGSRLLSIVDAGTYTDQRKAFEQIMEQFDAMNTENQNYQITRRQAVISLATFPFAPPINLEKRERVASSYYELFLQECGASLAACDELGNSSNPDDLRLAFRCACRYLAELKVISHTSSRYRMQALELAAHCAILKTSLSWGRAGKPMALLCAQDAITISRDSGNICWLLNAYSDLAWGYVENDQRELALQTAREARELLENHERHKERLPVCVRGVTRMTLSIMQARNGLSPDTALQKAIEQGADNQVLYGRDFRPVRMLIDQGKTLYYAERYGEALRTYTQLVDPNTLVATESFKETLTETWRMDTILQMALASMNGADRDRQNAIHYWKEAIEGAKRLKCEFVYSGALSAHDEMKKAFPGDKEVYNLRDHFRPGKGWK